MHNGGRLGNQLWLVAAVYAFCLEHGYRFDNPSFFEYQAFFGKKMQPASLFARFFNKSYFVATRTLGISDSFAREMYYEKYTFWIDIFSYFRKDEIIFDNDQKSQKTLKIFLWKRAMFLKNLFKRIVYGKPAIASAYAVKSSVKIIDLETLPTQFPSYFESTTSPSSPVYLYGWFFRNPVGILKYQKEIVDFLSPIPSITDKIDKQIASLRRTYKTIVGVHIRLGDTRNEYIEGKKVSFGEAEVVPILKQYLHFSGQQPADVCFVICSDEKIDRTIFAGLNIFVTSDEKYNAIEDLWLLSKTDIIIGADSSFAVTASFLGNKAFIVFSRLAIDWEYYRGKQTFFVNKYIERFVY